MRPVSALQYLGRSGGVLHYLNSVAVDLGACATLQGRGMMRDGRCAVAAPGTNQGSAEPIQPIPRSPHAYYSGESASHDERISEAMVKLFLKTTKAVKDD
jgi:hypothetical protein